MIAAIYTPVRAPTRASTVAGGLNPGGADGTGYRRTSSGRESQASLPPAVFPLDPYAISVTIVNRRAPRASPLRGAAGGSARARHHGTTYLALRPPPTRRSCPSRAKATSSRRACSPEMPHSAASSPLVTDPRAAASRSPICRRIAECSRSSPRSAGRTAATLDGARRTGRRRTKPRSSALTHPPRLGRSSPARAPPPTHERCPASGASARRRAPLWLLQRPRAHTER